MVLTDSGGIQEETTVYGIPCITLREETEWIDTVETGWNTLVGADADRFETALLTPRPELRPPVFGDGHAAERIAAAVLANVGTRATA